MKKTMLKNKNQFNKVIHPKLSFNFGLSLFFAGFLISSIGQAAPLFKTLKDIPHDISNELDAAENYQFLHCKPALTKKNETVTHYIIDTNNAQITRLFSTNAPTSNTAQNLKNLKLIDSQVLELNPNQGFDISFQSKSQPILFNLTIQDSNGQVFTVEVETSRSITSIQCIDVSIEKDED